MVTQGEELVGIVPPFGSIYADAPWRDVTEMASDDGEDGKWRQVIQFPKTNAPYGYVFALGCVRTFDLLVPGKPPAVVCRSLLERRLGTCASVCLIVNLCQSTSLLARRMWTRIEAFVAVVSHRRAVHSRLDRVTS